MTEVQRVCVYCSARNAVDDVYLKAARDLGQILAENHKSLVYGGGSNGLMGAVTDAVIKHGGHVTGVITEYLKDIERMHLQVEDLIVVKTMHERKRIMAERSDGFVVLPGGFGTLEEFFEILTWRQLGLHDKPIILVNINGYWDHLMELAHQMRDGHFISPEDLDQFTRVNSVQDVLKSFEVQKTSDKETHMDLV